MNANGAPGSSQAHACLSVVSHILTQIHVCVGVMGCPCRAFVHGPLKYSAIPSVERITCGAYLLGVVVFSIITGRYVVTAAMCIHQRWGRCGKLVRQHDDLYRPQIRRDYPLNLSISISGGKETNQDSPSNGERTGNSSNFKSRAPASANCSFQKRYPQEDRRSKLLGTAYRRG